MKKRNNGKWRKKRIAKTVTMKGVIRWSDCIPDGYAINEHKPNGIWKGKKHTLYVRKKSKWTSGGVKLSNGENNSNHTLLNRFNETYTAMPCP